ncbi:L-2-hydroxyglutarate oxidase [Ornithinibacillus sp. 4-3]|uniref:L-2-hydroxyglutarate oxidase n=1 Tax=Ornithinibacillus sp. 4-3 TaxID=3231488 RepID=A0AB39HK89_9BACI
MFDYIVVGGGIVGLSVSYELLKQKPDAKLLLLEKEDELAKHQTGHNSGVIHSGIYYQPGSYKARFAKAGNESMKAFCEAHGIDFDPCGKIIVATKEEELPLLQNLYERGQQNELVIKKINQDELRELEPHVNGIEGISVPAAGIVNYKQVSEKLGELIREAGGEILLESPVQAITENPDEVVVETKRGNYKGKLLVNCAGLHSDRIAKMAGYHADLKIVPFRGEYYKLKPEKRYLVKNLIYPVPNPDFPFLGVHFTRMIDGEVEAGPNAVLSFKREGYRKTDFHVKDLGETLMYKGFWKLAGKYMKEGLEEMKRSFSKGLFVKSLQELIPEITEDDLISAPAGVRAQALLSDGSLVDDFQIIDGKRSIHICNAPSPAATASLQIGEEISRRIFALKS